MAQKFETIFIDDLDGSQAAGTVFFGLDGTHYEIDLSAGHAGDLRSALNPYIEAGRKITGPRRSSRRPSAGSPDSTEVRIWAKARGIEVKDRGRVPAGIVAQYQADKDK